MVTILHTEASPGWGGQEMRILKEAIGMRERGYELLLAVQEGGGLVPQARAAGFQVYELSFAKKNFLKTFWSLLKIMRRHKVDLINTHSSMDAWIGGVAARLLRIPIIRTRHLSTPIKAGLNSRLLYNTLADTVVTTCQETAEILRKQAHLSEKRCLSIPTGVDPKALTVDPEAVIAFRQSLGVAPDDVLAGTLCVLRGWKGVSDLLHAAALCRGVPHLKWVIVGGGVSEEHFRNEWRTLGLEGSVFFTGQLTPPYTALAAMDIFLLLSWANEGVSQASLQAAYLQKPLVTTSIGGLKEVCIEGKSGFLVPPHAPHEVAKAVERLALDPSLREQMGKTAREIVLEQFTFEQLMGSTERVVSRSLSRGA